MTDFELSKFSTTRKFTKHLNLKITFPPLLYEWCDKVVRIQFFYKIYFIDINLE